MKAYLNVSVITSRQPAIHFVNINFDMIRKNQLATSKGPATRNDFVNDIVNDARADAIFATLKAIVDDETSTISLRVAWP